MGRRGRRDGGTNRLRPPASLLCSHRGSTSTSTPRPSVAMVTLLHWVFCRPRSSSVGWALSASLDVLQRQYLPIVIWFTHPSLFLSLITYTDGLTKPLIPPGNTKPKPTPSKKKKSQSCSGPPPSQAGIGLAWAGS